jgi:hypothetical protein
VYTLVWSCNDCVQIREQHCGDGDELQSLRVSTSVCTGQCAWAPNVNVSIRGAVSSHLHHLNLCLFRGKNTCVGLSGDRVPTCQEWEAQKQVNTPVLCARVVNNLVAGVRRDSTAAPAVPRDGIMQMRAAGMRYNALKHISRSKNSADAQREGDKLLDEALEAERRAAQGDEKLLARAQRRADRLQLLRARGMLTPGDIACYRKVHDPADEARWRGEIGREEDGEQASLVKSQVALHVMVEIEVSRAGHATLMLINPLLRCERGCRSFR